MRRQLGLGAESVNCTERSTRRQSVPEKTNVNAKTQRRKDRKLKMTLLFSALYVFAPLRSNFLFGWGRRRRLVNSDVVRRRRLGWRGEGFAVFVLRQFL